MLIEFSVGNFHSFKDIQTIHFQAAKIKSKYERLVQDNVFDAPKGEQLLKTKALYGANSSGKSNLVKAVVSMLNIIQNSFRNEDIIKLLIEPFRLSTETIKEPTFFQIVFILENVPYRYGMELRDGKVESEWLFGQPNRREVYYFLREGMNVQVNEKRFKEANQLINLKKGETPLYGDTSLFLTVAAASKRKLAKSILEYLTMSITVSSGLGDLGGTDLAMNMLDDTRFKTKLIDLFQSADMDIVGIEKVEIDLAEIPEKVQKILMANSKNKKLGFVQINKDVFDEKLQKVKTTEFMLHEHEAEGTKKLFYLSPFLFDTLEKGNILILDEFDARMHPRLTRKIIEQFNSNDTNPNNAQLLIITHDTNLMDAKLLRRDQISFVDKNKYGASKIYSLAHYKGIRNDASFEKDYLKGKYGAVPFLNKMNLFYSDDKTQNNVKEAN